MIAARLIAFASVLTVVAEDTIEVPLIIIVPTATVLTALLVTTGHDSNHAEDPTSTHCPNV